MNRKADCRSMPSIFIVGLCFWINCLPARADAPCASITLDRLPLLPRNVSLHQFSSHNKKGLNGDADWILYRDENGDAVVFDAAGPGCVRSIWQTQISSAQILKFYFDGETEPRYAIPAVDFYRGKHPDFPAPLNSYEKLGYYIEDAYAGNCFTPIPFAKSLKIAIRGPSSFHHFLYERYPHGTPVTTFTGKEDREYLLKAFARRGEELDPPADVEVIRTSVKELKPEEKLELLKVEKGGTVARITIEGESSAEFLRQVELALQWDESTRPDAIAPLGMFFGAAVRPEAVRALPVKVELLPEGRIRLTCYFRMPFWRKASIALMNPKSPHAKAFGPINAEVRLIPQRYAEDETGYFCALYRDGRTEMARDWLFFDAAGTGRFVGAVQTMQGGHYCEGDEHFSVDGAGMPQINGTGTEDYYLACYWPNRNFNLPFAGCVGDIKQQPGAACYYRFHLEAPIPFYNLLDARIEHGGASNIVSDYRSLGFCYLRKRPVLRQTDFLDVAGEASERAHGYRATRSMPTEDLEASYEGGAAGTMIRDRGRTHEGGEIAFTVAIDPDNRGVRLRRRLDQASPRQSAEVYVDGKYAGRWYHADRNPYLRWFDAEVDLPGELTRGKTELKIRLAVEQKPGYGHFTDYRYDVLTFTGK
ncbi:MAG: DUF2961 domain-containing protein [Pirellulales bacterium]|nr:DUF2961 domain-containing protein [Pirellulales bacterium]